MKKRFVGLTLALVMVFSLSAITYADPGSGGTQEPICLIEPTMAPICIIPDCEYEQP